MQPMVWPPIQEYLKHFPRKNDELLFITKKGNLVVWVRTKTENELKNGTSTNDPAPILYIRSDSLSQRWNKLKRERPPNASMASRQGSTSRQSFPMWSQQGLYQGIQKSYGARELRYQSNGVWITYHIGPEQIGLFCPRTHLFYWRFDTVTKNFDIL